MRDQASGVMCFMYTVISFNPHQVGALLSYVTAAQRCSVGWLCLWDNSRQQWYPLLGCPWTERHIKIIFIKQGSRAPVSQEHLLFPLFSPACTINIYKVLHNEDLRQWSQLVVLFKCRLDQKRTCLLSSVVCKGTQIFYGSSVNIYGKILINILQLSVT